MPTNRPRLELGRIVATPGALQAFEASGDFPANYISRHIAGDWGDLTALDFAANEQAVELGYRVLSAYLLSNGIKIWIISEADRRSTCILLPSEY